MTAENIGTLSQGVNGATAHRPTIDEVIDWVRKQSNKADMGESAARIRVTSLQQMAEQVDADSEPAGDAIWIQENIERLRERWMRRHPEGKAETAASYAARANATIRGYLEWSADPYAYDKRKSAPKAADGSAKRPAAAKSKPKAPATAAPPPAPTPAPPVAARGEMRTFPLGDGRNFVFAMPTDGMTFAEIKKACVHMFTLATDFDISDGAQAQVFAMVVRGNRD